MIYLIRHAESVGNAGGKNFSNALNPLTEKGIQQSIKLLQRIPAKPDLIVVSPYQRSQQTAEPLIKKYPDVPVEIWKVQEFTSLDLSLYEDTTHDERKVIQKEYLAKNDPDFIHGEGAESFNQLLQRADDMLDKLKNIDKDKFVVIFTHGHFIRAVLARRNKQIVTFNAVFEGQTIANTDIIVL